LNISLPEKLVRPPGVAPGQALWKRAILLLNHNREIKGPEMSIAPPARAISTKNKHLLVIFSDPNPRIHGGCFGV
jgi:hypothetical protein